MESLYPTLESRIDVPWEGETVMLKLSRLFFLLVLFRLVSTAAFAQFEAASVVGTAQDQGGAVIPNVTVEITNLGTNVRRQTATNSRGVWTFVALEPGQYTVALKKSGFNNETRSFQLSVGQQLSLNITMIVGTKVETVTVNATGEMLETASSEIGNVRSTQQVVNLPLNSRNFTQLVLLAPGVVNHGQGTNSVNGGYSAGRGTNGSNINGNPSDLGDYLFDGIQSNDVDTNVLIFFPPVDAIQEFNVETSAAPAAYGGAPTVINATFRSGTNNLHGALYEFVRNSDLDAKNYFDSHTAPIPPFHMNQFGANLSGPVVVPRLFNGKDKLFFFIDYEGKRQTQSQTYISTVPTAAFKTGDFSALKQVLTIPGTTTPLPNNQVQSIDPTAATLVALFPAPNYGPAGALVSNYLYNPILMNNIDQGDVRIDFHTSVSSIFGRFSREDPTTFNPGYLPPPAIGGGPSYPGTTIAPGKQVVLGYGRSFGASKYYEARLGFSRLTEHIIDEGSTLGNNIAEKYGIPNANVGSSAANTAEAQGFTNLVITSNASLGDNAGSITKANNVWEFDQAFSWTHGKHNFKFGGSWGSARYAFISPSHPYGTMSFSGVYTGYGLADFLYGRPISSQLDVAPFFSMLRFRPNVYAEDSYRVTPKLTVTYGLRDSFYTPWHERSNRLACWDPDNGGSLIVVGSGTGPCPGDTVTAGRYTNFAPRLGFAYSIDSKTVLRGGAGIFYSYETYNSNPEVKNAPYNGSIIATNSSGAAGYAAASPISAGFPASRPTLFPTLGSAFQAYQWRNPNTSENEFNLNIQRQLTSHDVISVAYVGQTGVHILINPNINQPAPGAGAVASRRPFPSFASGTLNCYCANSSYNSLQVLYRYRVSSGFDFQGTYTYSHSIDSSSGSANLAGIQNPFNLRQYKGNSDFDTRHQAVLSWSYKLPFGSGMRFASDAHGIENAVIGGWQLNSIDSFATGSPFTPVMSTSLLNTGGSTQWPNRVGSGKLANPSIKAWFNTTDFVSPGNYTYGNSRRNILFGPGTKQFDMSLFKEFPLGENQARHLELRAETFNIFNTPQFNNPNSSIGNAADGTITSAGSPLLFQRASREIQLAAKLYF